jgi:hypothetical protein
MKTELQNFRNYIQTEDGLKLAYLSCRHYNLKHINNVLHFNEKGIDNYTDALKACSILHDIGTHDLANESIKLLSEDIQTHSKPFTNWFIIVASSLEWPIVTLEPIECVKGQDAVIEEYRTHADFDGIIEVSWYRKPIGSESIDQDLCNESIILKKHLFDYIDEQHPGEQPASMDEDLTEYIAEYIKAGKLIYTE